MTLTNKNATSTNNNATSINNRATSRTLATTDAANPRFYNDRKGATAQKGNPNGHIIRWAEDSGNAGATGFRWELSLHAKKPASCAGFSIRHRYYQAVDRLPCNDCQISSGLKRRYIIK
jgi:secreted PhoX family phosphatase